MYRVVLNKVIEKFLLKHRGDSIFDQFEQAVLLLSQNPYNNTLAISKLKWYDLMYRLRLWGYRFIYEVNNKDIVIIFIDAWSRGDIYKKY